MGFWSTLGALWVYDRFLKPGTIDLVDDEPGKMQLYPAKDEQVTELLETHGDVLSVMRDEDMPEEARDFASELVHYVEIGELSADDAAMLLKGYLSDVVGLDEDDVQDKSANEMAGHAGSDPHNHFQEN